MQRPGARRKPKFLWRPFRVAGRRSRSQRRSVGAKYWHKLCEQARELFATACPPWWGESVQMADTEQGAEGW